MTPKAAKAANGRLDWVVPVRLRLRLQVLLLSSNIRRGTAASGAVTFACSAVVFAAASGTRVTSISTVSFFAGTDVMFAV